jgi:hypothetical protein
MALGNRIILTPDRCEWVEGICGAGLSPKPGTVMEYDYSQATQGNRFVWRLYQPGADGGRPKGPLVIVTEDLLQGRTTSDAYAAGERIFGAVPRVGCELNLLLLDVAGTADDHAKGELLIPKNNNGRWIATTGTPDIKPAVCNETVTDPVADTLIHALWTGY